MSSAKPNRPVFAPCDANSFYASCEKLFRPDLRTAPVVVLSNNDGCAIAQSKEAKVLGIRMAGPWFEVEERSRAIGVVEFSSNYELYANMSTRFMATLRQFSPRQKVSSIDECFLDFTGMKRDRVAYGQTIKETVMRWTGLPICVGIGHSKTLAKLGNHYAKKELKTKGVCDFTQLSQQELDSILEKLMETVDSINRKYKRNTIHLASEGTARTWSMRRSFKSPNYTGDWHELPVVS